MLPMWEWIGTSSITLSSFEFRTSGAQTISTANDGGLANDTSASITVKPASFDHFIVDNILDPQEAGVNFQITVRAVDQFDNFRNDFVEKVYLQATGDGGANTITTESSGYTTNETDNFTAGVWTGRVRITTADMNVYIHGDDDAGHNINNSNTFEVSPGMLHHFDLIINPQTNTQAFIPTAQLIGKDSFGNTRGFDASENNITLTSSDGVLTNNVINVNVPGGVFDITTLGTTYTGPAAQITITATQAGTGFTGNTAVTINPGPANSFDITTVVSSPQAAGVPLFMEIHALDISGNIAVSYNGTANISDIDGTANTMSPLSVVFKNGIWSGNLTVTESTTALNRVQIQVSAGGITSDTSNVFDVDPGPVDHFVFNSGPPNPVARGSAFAVVIHAQDAYNSFWYRFR